MQRADLVALSCSLAHHLGELRAAITALRAHRRLAGTPILVGGRAFLVSNELWRAVGADGTARDALEAAATAERLVPIGRNPAMRTSVG
jgi:methanogenic corrinoid protein MtbC1